MAFEMVGTGAMVSELEIRRAEKRIGVIFPPEYREFLLKYNGGRPVAKYFQIPESEFRNVGKVLDFFGLDDPVESCNIDWNCEVYKKRIPSGFLPIACEDGGNIVCIRSAPPDLGAIYYWNHDFEGASLSYKSLYKISSSLNEFLTNLVPAGDIR